DQYLLNCELQTLDNGLISGAFYSYGSGGQLTDKKEYNFNIITSASACSNSASAPASPSRETVASYPTFGNSPLYGSQTIYDRPCSVVIKSGAANVGETDYYYDGTNPTSAPCGAPSTQSLPGTGAYSQHDETYFGSSASVSRGNATAVKRKCLAG